jgi:hypothetical protein
MPSGKNLDTATVGAKTFTVQAADLVGNEASLTHNYQVVYDFKGFFQPVDNPGSNNDVYNGIKIGSAVPIKFSLGGAYGLEVISDVSLRPLPKATGISVDTIEQPLSATTGGNLSYDPATDRYTYVWKTQKEWTTQYPSGAELVITLADGTEHTALFQFK